MKNILKISASLAIIIAFSFGATAQAFTIGQRGSDVSDLQAKLIEAGYDIPAITLGGAAFGYFGSQTEAALGAYIAAGNSDTAPVKLGAASGDFYGPTSQNGVVTNASRIGFRNASTTVCSFLITATSSLSFFSFQVASTSATQTQYELATSTNFNATTSRIALFTPIAANKTASAAWNGDQTLNGIVSPGTYLNLNVGDVVGGGFPGGSCQYEAKTL